MSEQFRPNRAKGFVAVPVEIMEIDLSPGAFRLLLELCRMANKDGACWPSLGQLSDRIGRSRATLSGYLTELRDADLVTTEEQKMANGYNYRLRYTVVFWKKWRADIAHGAHTQTIKKDERSVRNGERLDKSKNQIHKNHPFADFQKRIFAELIREWTEQTGKAPYPAFAAPPSKTLVNRTKKTLRDNFPAPASKAKVQKGLKEFWADISVDITPETIQFHVDLVIGKQFTSFEVKGYIDHLRKSWPPNWRMSPSKKWLIETAKSLPFTSQAAQKKLLQSFHSRYELDKTTSRKRNLDTSTPTNCLV